MYRRERAVDYRVVDRWHRGVGWRAYPEEDGLRTSQAVQTADAAVFAERHGVPVTVPAGLDRAAERVDAPVRRVTDSLAGFELRPLEPLGAWTETVAYRESDRTLYVPDVLSSGAAVTVGDERLGLNVLARLRPPRETFADMAPDRVLLGHGEGVFDDAAGALDESLAKARRRLPRALVSTAPRELKAMVVAVR